MNNNYYNPELSNYMAARQHAEQLVKAKIGFYWHLTVYTVINGLLILIYLFTSWEAGGLYYPWFLWPLVGWGVGLFFNFLAVYVFPDTPERRQRMVETELERMGLPGRPELPLYPPPTPTPTTSEPATSADSNNPNQFVPR